jgi:hypothetical protein
VLERRFLLMSMIIATSSILCAPSAWANRTNPARLAIYYGYPSLVNGSNGDLEKAASVFSNYDVVVLGDGLEFEDRQPGRYPEGDPIEHQKVQQIMGAVRKRNPATRFYGYVCLGEIPWPKGQQTALSPKELEQRIQLWKQMGASGIFLDEAGYDFVAITRKRQNLAVQMVHESGLSAFMNAYFIDHLFSREDNLPNANGLKKNPESLAPLLDHRDLFLLESFEVKNGVYEGAAAAQVRLSQALAYRQRYGAQIFATTTTTEQQPFNAEQFSYAWWTARIYGLDGFSWGEPDFAALTNTLPDRQCRGESAVPIFQGSSEVGSDDTHIWRKSGDFFIVVETGIHSVTRIDAPDSAGPNGIGMVLSSSLRRTPLACRATEQ